jgi:hypothetical protein
MRKTSEALCLNSSDRCKRHFQKTYLSPNYRRQIFDTFDHAFALVPGPGHQQSREYNTALYVSIAQSFGVKKGIYGAGAISKGALANVLAVQEGPFSIEHDDGSIVSAFHVYDMDETCGSQNFVDMVLEPNKRMQLQKLALFRAAFPGEHILIPSVLQGALGFTGSPEFDRGAKRRDRNFMQLWTPIIREHIHIIPVVGDWFFSGATQGLEYPEAECIAAGLRDSRPEADMWFRDINNRDVPLSEIIQRRAEYLVWTAEQGDFYLKHEATALMRSFAIAEMAQREKLTSGNPVFLKGIEDNIDDITYMRRQIEPLILDRIRAKMVRIDTTDLRRVNPDFVKKAEAAKTESRKALVRSRKVEPINLEKLRETLTEGNIKLERYSLERLAAGDFESRELSELFDPTTYLDRTDGLVATLPMRPLDMKGKAYTEYDGTSLFSRPLLQHLNDRERHQVSAVIGGTETTMPREGRLLFVIADDHFGTKTQAAQKIHGLSRGDHVQSRLGAAFDRTMRKPQRRYTLELPILQRFRDQNQSVRFSHDLRDQILAFNELQDFSMAPGESMPGENAALLVRQKILARNGTDFCFVTGQWEESPNGVQDMILATRMQLGLEASCPQDSLAVRVFDERGRYLTILDRFKAVWEPLEKVLSINGDPQGLEEQVTAVAQLWTLHRLCRAHTMRHHVFDNLRQHNPDIELPEDLSWERINPTLFFYDHLEFETLWHNHVKPLLEGPAAAVLRLRHLDEIEDFASIQRRQQALQSISSAATTQGTIYRRNRLWEATQ